MRWSEGLSWGDKGVDRDVFKRGFLHRSSLRPFLGEKPLPHVAGLIAFVAAVMGDEALFDRIAFVLKGVGISTMRHSFEHCVLHIAIDGFEFVKGFLCECCADSRVSITVKGPNRNVSEFFSIKRRKESAGTGDGGGEAI